MNAKQLALARVMGRLRKVPQFRAHYGERVRTILRSRPGDDGPAGLAGTGDATPAATDADGVPSSERWEPSFYIEGQGRIALCTIRFVRLRREDTRPDGEWVPVALTLQPFVLAPEPLLQPRGPVPHGINYLALDDVRP